MRRLEGRAAELELGLNNSVAELGLKDSAAQKEQATARDAEPALELSELRVMVQKLDLKLKAAEKDRRAARLKLDDVMVDTSMEDALEAKVEALMEEL